MPTAPRPVAPGTLRASMEQAPTFLVLIAYDAPLVDDLLAELDAYPDGDPLRGVADALRRTLLLALVKRWSYHALTRDRLIAEARDQVEGAITRAKVLRVFGALGVRFDDEVPPDTVEAVDRFVGRDDGGALVEDALRRARDAEAGA